MEVNCDICLQIDEDIEKIKIVNLEKKHWKVCYICFQQLKHDKYIVHCLESELPNQTFDENFQEFKCMKPFVYYEKLPKVVELKHMY